jgi:hypothetical protein
MTVTPEGYLVCQNTNIGRTGWMDYQGQEIPASFNEPMGTKVRVYRSPEELFSPTTIASFEGKPITNLHPTANLDVNTASAIERGHVQNVRPQGEFLVGDLHIRDAGLISEIVNDLKREVSSGYDCSWHKIDGGYEQREIVGNHVAVVQNGRAGHKVAIHDAEPEETPDVVKVKSEEKPIGRRPKMKKFTKDILQAIGFKQMAQDAEPEDIAQAIEAMKEDDAKDCHDKKVKDEAPPDAPKKEEVKDEEPPAWFKAYKEEQDKAAKDKAAKDEESGATLKDLMAKVEALKGAEKKEETKETADSVLDALKEDLEKDETEEEKADREKKEAADKAAKDALTAPDPDAPKKTAADAFIRKIVQDMAPSILAIPDEAARLEAARKFRQGIQDIRGRAAANSYADILDVVAGNKKAAMDTFQQTKQASMEERAEVACDNWNKAGEAMKKL